MQTGNIRHSTLTVKDCLHMNWSSVIQQSKSSNYGERSTQTVRSNRNKQNVIPGTEQAAQQFLVLSRLRRILAKHRTLQGDENLELTSSLREDMLVFMPEKDIAKIRFPAPSVDDVIDQIRRNEISLVQDQKRYLNGLSEYSLRGPFQALKLLPPQALYLIG